VYKHILIFFACFCTLFSIFLSGDDSPASAHRTLSTSHDARTNTLLASGEEAPCFSLDAKAKEVAPGTNEIAFAFEFQFHAINPVTRFPCPRTGTLYFTLDWGRAKLDPRMRRLRNVTITQKQVLEFEHPYSIPRDLDKSVKYARIKKQRPDLRISDDGFYLLISIPPPHPCPTYQVPVKLRLDGEPDAQYVANGGSSWYLQRDWAQIVTMHP